MSTSPGRAYIDRRIELVTSGNYDELVEAGYNDNAQLISLDGTIQGKEALKANFRQHLPAMGKVTLKSVDKFVESADTLFVQLTVSTANYGEVTSFEAFVLRGGKADYHFTALK